MSKPEDFATGASLATARQIKKRAHEPRLDRTTVHTKELTPKAKESKRVAPSPVAVVVPAPTSEPKPRAKAPSTEPSTRTVEREARREPTVVIPRQTPAVEREAPAGHRLCPTPATANHKLVRQTIGMETCEQRQCGGYHKCATCSHAERPQWAGTELPAPANGPSALARDRIREV